MPRLRVHNFSMSIDGYGAGVDQTLENPLGVRGARLHEWVFATRAGRRMIGEDGGSEGIDHEFFERGEAGFGATIMGRNMFGPIRGPWTPEESSGEWKGWWGDNPPYHHPVFVLTHHARPVVLGRGERLFDHLDGGPDGYECVELVSSPGVAHVRLARRARARSA